MEEKIIKLIVNEAEYAKVNDTYVLDGSQVQYLVQKIVKLFTVSVVVNRRGMAGKPPNWKCLKAEMRSRVRMVDYARGNGVTDSSNHPPLCFTTLHNNNLQT